ncbi:MAG TPA: hypothetical protein VH112_11155 [Acidimicrobiales bacterium]|nr:hypothetical protein [Acidimicrobiales bacterium]
MDGERASLIVPGTTLLATLVAGTTYAVYRAHQLAERWRPRGVSALPVLFVVATSISYVANGGTLSQPAPHGLPGAAQPSPPPAAPPSPSPPVATRGVPDYALPRQGLDISYDFGPGPHPVPGPTSAASATFPAPPKAAPPRPASPSPPPPPPRPPPPRRSPIPPLPPLPRPPIPPVPIPAVR